MGECFGSVTSGGGGGSSRAKGIREQDAVGEPQSDGQRVNSLGGRWWWDAVSINEKSGDQSIGASFQCVGHKPIRQVCPHEACHDKMAAHLY